MRENNIYAKARRKFEATTDSHHNFPLAENLVNQNLTSFGFLIFSPSPPEGEGRGEGEQKDNLKGKTG